LVLSFSLLSRGRRKEREGRKREGREEKPCLDNYRNNAK
jgi:hypothetical protein